MNKIIGLFTLLLYCALWTSCSSQGGKLVDGSVIFSVQKHEGFYGTHSLDIDSLLAKNKQGSWVTIWKGIRSVEKTWGDKVLFVAQTSNKSVDEDYSLLFYENEKEVVDITSDLIAIKERTLKQYKMAETNTVKLKWGYDAEGIILTFDFGQTIKTKIPLNQIIEVSGRVKARSALCSFNENKFYK